MGMITRVRGRLRSLHTLPKLDEKVRDEKIAETVCLLSVLFLLPYCSRGHAPLLVSLGSWFLTTYSFLVLPILISANYKYPVRWLRHIIRKLPGMAKKYSRPTWNLIRKVYAPIDRCEKSFMKMKNISNLATQLVFFMLCDRVLLCSFGGHHCPQKKVTGLYSLMFYNVIAYCVSYIKELIEKEDWSITVNMTQHSNIKHLAMSATKIVLEWTKAVTFIITVTFMLLVFGLEQGLEHYRPTALYTFVTWTYYMCTEKVFVDLFLPTLLLLKIKSLEALEQFYAPVFLRFYTIGWAVLMAICLMLLGQFHFAFFAFYITVYLKVKDTIFNCLRTLKREQAMLGQFRCATFEEIENCDDVCAVCLCPMERARVTPCQHMFHASCLRECLNNSNNCPICKREYVFVH
ncbi:uncharacterized protein LOC109543538 isoform X1 [Dendroctonus ponderosae]|nr:uncharacterized protein LOC109543538 isoform X1 [Dendroctonus ponderosae]KAH1006826.1 hypothetical protein HUJ05_007521 [Dendroctonus ponderosae]